MNQLPENLSMRAPTMADGQAVSNLIMARDLQEYGSTDWDPAEIEDEWTKPRFDLDQDARVVTAPDGSIVGYEEVWLRDATHLALDGYVHPQFEGRGIGTALLQWAKDRSDQHLISAPDRQLTLRVSSSGADRGAQPLFEAEGFQLVRQFWRMEIELTEPPIEPTWPIGITVRSFVDNQDERATYEAGEEAFEDHWGHIVVPYADWLRRIKNDDSDRSLWHLAIDGDQIAGMSICRKRPDVAWLSTLAVRRAWRHQGLGLALLQHSFAEYYRRGERLIGLGVDAQSLTGATRLYERAGMHVARQYDTFEKLLKNPN